MIGDLGKSRLTSELITLFDALIIDPHAAKATLDLIRNQMGRGLLGRREALLGVVLPPLYNGASSHTRITTCAILVFGRRQAMPVGNGGRPMGDTQKERALLDLSHARGLRLSTPSSVLLTP